MSQWVLRTRIRRRRCAIVKAIEPGGGVHWCGSVADAQRFDSRKAAVAAARDWNADVLAHNMPWVKLYPETELRWNPEAYRAARAARWAKTGVRYRGAQPMPTDLAAKYDAALAAVRSRAAETGTAIPEFATYYVPTRVGSCRGGGLLRGQLHIMLKLWAFDRDHDFLVYIVAHEIAHVIDYATRGTSDHSATWRAILRKVCPPPAMKHLLRGGAKVASVQATLDDLIARMLAAGVTQS